ncbi:MAG: AsmA family protein, partial [Polaribacter sp.]
GNYDIAIKKKATPNTASESSFSLNIQEYELKNINFKYSDQNAHIKVRLDSIYHTGKGNFAKDLLDLDTKTTAKLSFDMNNVNYIHNLVVKLNAVLGIDLKNSKYTFKKNTGYINQLPLEFNGFLQQVAKNQLYDITFKTPNSSFKNLLALLPKQYAGNLKTIKTEGNFDLNGTVKGKYSKTTIPKLAISFSAKNAMFKYADLPKSVKNINLNATIINKTGVSKDTYIDIQNTSFSIDKDVFNAKGKISNIKENPYVNLQAKGVINLANINKVYPISIKKQLEGILKADINSSFDMNSIEKENYQNIKNTGQISVTNFKYKGDDFANPFLIDKTAISFNTNTIKLNEFTAKTGSSDISLTGNLTNFYGFLFKDKKLKGNFSLNSTTFKIDDFLTKKEQKTDEKKSEKSLKIPAFLDIKLSAKAKKVLYNDIMLTNLSGVLFIADETVRLQNVSSAVFDGKINFDGKVTTKGSKPNFQMDLKMQKLNIAESFSKLEMLKSIAPIAKSIDGKINTTIKVSGNLAEDMTPVLTSISGNLLGQLLNTKIKTNNSKVLSAISQNFDFIDLSKLNLNNVKALFTFKNGEVNVQPFHLNYKDIGIKAAGKHGFDNTMNYNITFDVPVKYLGANIANSLAKLASKDAATIKTIPVNTTLTGSFSNPNFSANIKDATSTLLKTIVEKQKQRLLNKGTDKLQELLFGNKTKKDTAKTKSASEKTTDKVKDVLKGLFKKKKNTSN